MAFLRELRSILSLPEPVSVEPEKVLEFQLFWFRKSGYFAKEVAHVIQAEEKVECDRVKAENDERKEQVTTIAEKISNFVTILFLLRALRKLRNAEREREEVHLNVRPGHGHTGAIERKKGIRYHRSVAVI